MQGDENKKLSARGWSRKNILTGAIVFVIGFILFSAAFFLGYISIGDSDRPTPVWISFLNWFGLAAMILGILGYCFVIPAFQKWWHTQKWMAWIFLVIGILLIYPLLAILGSVLFAL